MYVQVASGGDDGERKDYWLSRGLVVKVMNKKVGDGKYYKLKGRVDKVIERYTGKKTTASKWKETKPLVG